MAKTPYDISIVLDQILDEPSNQSFTSSLTQSWSDLGIGALDWQTWWHNTSFLKPVQEATIEMVNEMPAMIVAIG